MSDTLRSIGQKNDHSIAIVLDKSIFSNVFNKDIRRAHFYQRAERLADVLYLIAPAFADSLSLKGRIENLAVALLDAALEPNASFVPAFSRELLALSSTLSLARAGGFISGMNSDIIEGEVRMLLRDTVGYEEPHITLDEAPTLAALSRQTVARTSVPVSPKRPRAVKDKDKGHIERSDTILSLIRRKESVTIKDISSVIRGVSEKTIQRELQTLIETGHIVRKGERRWSTYSLAP